MTDKKKGPFVMELGPVPEIFATHLLPLENGGEFVRLTFCAQHAFGAEDGPEMHICLRVAMTPSCAADLRRQMAERPRGGH
jgi:hypothetical protein